ncbi:hypothetical protein Q1695_011083 [Nippostrongylus brasiliensis]|nr:hypothetical protein Q1695_011083 [Nippostrongylus brasiliensis]
MLKLAVLVCLAAVCFGQGLQGPPPFLQNAPPATQKEFEQLLAGAGSMTDAQIDKLVLDWIAKQSPAIKSAFDAFVKEVKAAQAAGEAAHQRAIAGFSPAAKEADAKLTKIAADRTKTNQQKGAEIDALLKSLPPAIRNEIEAAMKG